MKFKSAQEAYSFYNHTFVLAADIVAGRYTVRYYIYDKHGNPIDWKYRRPYEGRAWFNRESKRRLHPAIEKVIVGYCYRPRDWHQLLLEWPHKSETDPNRLAYTQNETKGERDTQTITSIGKYLQRHFAMPDHEIRDVVALYTSTGTMEIRAHMQDIIEAVRKGPTSCMSKNISITCADGVERHPYAVYNPELGWSVAVRINGDSIDGRALIYTSPDGNGKGYFVRSYKRDPDGGYSHADEMLEAWLKSQDIMKCNEWEEARLAAYQVRDGWLMPYLDGSCQRVSYNSLARVLVVDGDGEYECDNTEGVTQDTEYGEQCEDCGTHEDADDMYWVGYHEDRRVCSGCIDNYTYVYGRNGRQYYIDNDNAVYVQSQGESYDVDYLSDNNIVELADGDYEHLDDAVYIEAHDEYHASNSDDICYAEDTERYELTDDCWQCAESNNWYTDDEDYELIDGEKVHPDYVPEQAELELELEVVAVTDVTVAADPQPIFKSEWLPAPGLDAHFANQETN